MGVELRPLGVACNIQCQYCYQNPQRDAGNFLRAYDLEKMKAAVERAGGGFTLFGGEALLVPLEDLEALWAWGLEKYGRNGVQSNGSLITDAHIDLFKRYKVHVGISIDGPGELNDVRWSGNLERTRATTARTEAAIERLCAERTPPSVIVTLHRANAAAEKLPRMHDWLRHLARIGVMSARLHILEVDNAFVRQKYALSTGENLAALSSFLALEPELRPMKLDVFQDMRRMLMGEDKNTTCVWNACDPYTTSAVRGVEGNGQSSNCGRTNKDGIDFTKADTPGFERYLALYQTPQEHNGCSGCRFFLMCKGQCPGTAVDGDWRNRTEHCEVWQTLYTRMEDQLLKEGQIPLSVRPERAQVEGIFLDAWAQGRNTTIAQALEELQRRQKAGRTAAALPPAPPASPPPGPGMDRSGLERLGFTLPPFTRTTWVDDEARAVWEPRLRRVAEAWQAIEWRSVAAGLRACGMVLASPEQFVANAGTWAEAGLSAVPLDLYSANSGHANRATRATPGRPYAFQLVVGAPSDVAAFKRAWDAGNGDEVGRLLGYPPCCYGFYRDVWVERGLTDTTWPMAVATAAPGDHPAARLAKAGGPPEVNVLWRWLGVRAVPHLPCSFDCAASLHLARALMHVGRGAGYAEEMDWLTEVLSWPVEWSALHGIAEIKTPVLKVAAQTDATACTYTVRWKGERYPAEGARGLKFPFVVPQTLKVTESRAYRRGLENPIVMLEVLQPGAGTGIGAQRPAPTH